ncbi:MAG: carbohydrate kinase family protein [Patescibacteria group bacterium]|jgi:sugar/nucleoside kinase (ribokinase family)|nr:carbohydrate kinase family protein [Patescibacteria group bacterium]
MSKLDIVTIGAAVKDYTLYTSEGKIFNTPQNLTAQKMLAFEYGAKINVQDAYSNLGGGAANAGVSFARLGLKTGIITRIGKDEIGEEVVVKFKTEGVNIDNIQIDQKRMTGFSVILATAKKEKEHVIFTHRAADEYLLINQKELSKISAGWYYLTSLTGQKWLSNLKQIFQTAKEKNVKISWNLGGVQLRAGRHTLAPFLMQTEVLILNKDEAIELVLSGVKLGRKNPNYLNRPIYLLNILSEWGPKIVIITEGKKDCWAYDGKRVYRQKPKAVKPLDTTGVGDSFGSAFIAGLHYEKKDIKKALRWGITNSSSVIKQIGAQNGLLTKSQMFKKIKI